MSVFESYADYYDVLYFDKDYDAECGFLESIFGKYSNKLIKTVLDLGCGTGGHALTLVERGYKITGVDMSSEMLEIGRRKAEKREIDIEFIQGDIRKIELNREFDAAISMFAVMSYKITNEDLISAFRTASRHLEKNGLFIFDAWFGPAVLSQKPSERFKVIEKGNERIIRLATPVLDVLNHTVDVKYKIIRFSAHRLVGEVDETHKVRFLFPQEIKLICDIVGFKVLELCPFKKLGKILTEKDWNATAIIRKV
jgi:ubiquinone/menaquinone biosynthesis C-methylase UbiE